MIISEIFKSIDGESLRSGEISTFIRSVGCNLRCGYCDSKYTWKDSNAITYTPQQILSICENLGSKNITFTGGEPLIQKDSDELIELLSKNDYNVCIETNGSIDFTTRNWFINNFPNIWVCADYKLYKSNEINKMLSLSTFSKLRDNDVLKFVVGSKEDLVETKRVINYLRDNNCNCYFYISPVFGSIDLKEIVKFMLDNDLQNKIRF